MSEVENPPAFPCTEYRNTSSDPLARPREIRHTGISLRDYFAAQAISAIIAWASNPQVAAAGFLNNNIKVAEGAYEIADAMLQARKATRTKEPQR